jgi:lactoylglutathione lyase
MRNQLAVNNLQFAITGSKKHYTLIFIMSSLKGIFCFLIILFSFQHSFAQKAKLDHISIYVKDLERSIAFYQNVMHLDTIPEPFHDSMHAWFKIGEGLQMHVIAGATENLVQPKRNHICFSTKSIPDFILSLSKTGIVYEDLQGKPNTIQKRVDGVQQIYFKDPDGNWIEVNDAR